MNRRYCLISSCRDEAMFAERTLESVTSQSIPPALWVIVDQGSADSTPEILADYARKFDYIEIFRPTDWAPRQISNDVVAAFDAGYATIDPSDYEYVCKLDLDLELPRRYFELLIDRMESDPRLGTCSGKPYFVSECGDLLSETCGDENSVGMAKFYRTKCLQAIGGFPRQPMWDGIDGHLCRMHGWIAASWDDEPLRFVDLRPTNSDRNWWSNHLRHGRGQYAMGTSPIYMLASALYRTTRPPKASAGLAMLLGYFAAMARRLPRYNNPPFRRFLREYHRSCLLHGKQRATDLLNSRQASAWQPQTRPARPAVRRSEMPSSIPMSPAF